MFASFADAFQMPSSARPQATPRTVPGGRQVLSESGFPPDVWGPSAWTLMHLVAASYPENPSEEAKRQYAAFFKSLQHVLPCGGCRQGLQYLMAGPHRLTSSVMADRLSLFRWTVDVHNAVNAKTGKPQRTDHMAWYRHYDQMRAG